MHIGFWENGAKTEPGQEVTLLLAKAISDMEKTGKSLEKVGGPLEGGGVHHHHH